MKPVYAVWCDDGIVAIFAEEAAAYTLRNEKRDELPNSCDVRVDKQILFTDRDDRNRLRS